MAKYYMHLLNGRPAQFDAKGGYIHYENKPSLKRMPTTLKELRRQQDIDKSSNSYCATYGYALIRE